MQQRAIRVAETIHLRRTPTDWLKPESVHTTRLEKTSMAASGRRTGHPLCLGTWLPP